MSFAPRPAIEAAAHLGRVGAHPLAARMHATVGMTWKFWLSLLICLGLIALMIEAIVTGAGPRIIVADLLGAVVAARIALMSGLGRAPAGVSAVAMVIVAVALYLAATAHVRPWLLGLTLLGAFIGGFMSLTRGQRTRTKITS
jgi:hypothetical protein